MNGNEIFVENELDVESNTTDIFPEKPPAQRKSREKSHYNARRKAIFAGYCTWPKWLLLLLPVALLSVGCAMCESLVANAATCGISTNHGHENKI